ncbi:MAG: hypothetical protein R3336_00100 [Phycisphaeraceae bacterium]|nr:hypothetical protein [Phycisphaeraceae bacterium]
MAKKKKKDPPPSPVTRLRNRLPWEERWHRPTMQRLTERLAQHHERAFNTIINRFESLDTVDIDLVWYGPSWRWTIAVSARPAEADPEGEDGGVLFYAICNPEGPMLVVPMEEPFVQSLPIRKIHKYVRDGVALAKQAVSIHWGDWTPNNQTEARHIIDLLERYHEWLAGTEPAEIEEED